ncbi:MAG: 3'-5' exonuclease domain-containing protein 2 [Bacteroidales bacterium]|nr:3'-5' exonuclease domain-containing protein 2 [Bacteroidales bacterium]MBO7182842.1 3'-5' exonuclease domain-containing protein 2 [Bacteroidales bacterium]
MSNFASTIDKEQLQGLETAVFPGKIVLLDAEEISPELEEIFRAEKLWGFDTESKPVFKKGAKNRIALIQMATKDTCYLVRLSKQFPPVLTEIFNNPEVMKVGLSSKDDFLQLRSICKDLKPQNVVELQSMVKSYGIEELSLQKIYAILFGQRISKTQRLSNWQAPELSEAQQQYAAMDAWSVREIYLKLQEFTPQAVRE